MPNPTTTHTAADSEDVQANITRYWSAGAASYHQHLPDKVEPAREVWGRVWTSVLPEHPVDVLDVGTGTGEVSLLLATLGHRVTGIDLAEGMLAVARERAATMATPPDLRLGDAVAPPFEAHSFDAITARYVMWTLREPTVALANWRELLRPGGILAVADSTWFPEGMDTAEPPSPGSRQDDFRRLYDDRVRQALPLAEARTIDDTAALISAAGFGDVTVTPLQEVYDLDDRYGVAPNHQVQMQFLISGRAG